MRKVLNSIFFHGKWKTASTGVLIAWRSWKDPSLDSLQFQPHLSHRPCLTWLVLETKIRIMIRYEQKCKTNSQENQYWMKTCTQFFNRCYQDLGWECDKNVLENHSLSSVVLSTLHLWRFLMALVFLNFLTPTVKWVYITGYRTIGNLSLFLITAQYWKQPQLQLHILFCWNYGNNFACLIMDMLEFLSFFPH